MIHAHLDTYAANMKQCCAWHADRVGMVWPVILDPGHAVDSELGLAKNCAPSPRQHVKSKVKSITQELSGISTRRRILEHVREKSRVCRNAEPSSALSTFCTLE